MTKEITNKLNSQMARNVAEAFVKQRLLTPAGYFNYYTVIVGEDLNHKPETIYADVLPVNEILITNTKTAINIFHEKCNPLKEFLVKVSVDLKTENLSSEILHKPLKLKTLTANTEVGGQKN